MSPAVNARPDSTAPRRATANPSAAPTDSPAPTTGRSRRHIQLAHPARANTHNTSRSSAVTGSPYPGGTAPAFQTPPRASSDPNTPKGVSERGAKASTPRGSVTAPPVRDGTSHGSDTRTSAHTNSPARDHHRMTAGPRRHSATGPAASAEISTEENPPIAAGISAHTNPAKPRPGVRSARRAVAATTHGRPAYPSSTAHWPSSRRSATKGFHT